MDKKRKIENTKTYKPFKYSFKTFNPVQKTVRELLKKNKNNNLVISANTSSGKTICAEFLMDQELRKGKKVIYLSPLKSLAEEKFVDWKKRFKKEVITIVTSDYSKSVNLLKDLNKSSIIIMTSEMLDHKTRTYGIEKDRWLKDVKLLIVDESHIISSEGRGSAVEASIIRFSVLNKNSRILFLSATMSNCEHFEEWLTALNGKVTDVIKSTWRPVELTFHYEPYKVAIKESNYNRNISMDYMETEKNKVKVAVSIVLKKVSKEKFLIFVHSKATGRMVVSELENEGIESVFHNSNVAKSERNEIEDEFKDKNSNLKVLVSTSTLAWGVNLPARNVIIVGVKRGMEDVDPLDIIQMAGRAGRYGIDDAGDVYLIVLPGIMEAWKNNLSNPRPLFSRLDSPKALAFQLLAEINNGLVKTDKDLVNWYKKTLRYLQYPQVPSCVDPLLIPSLRKIFMIDGSDPFTTTKLGEISSKMYFSPYDIYAWYCNFRSLLTIKDLDDYHLSKAIFDVPKNESWIPKPFQETLDEFERELSIRSIKVRKTSLMHVLVGYKCLSGDDMGGGILNVIKREMMFDIDRVMVAITLINHTTSNGGMLDDIINSISLRIKYGVSEEAVELVRIPGIGAKRAGILIEEDLYSAKDIVKNKRILKEVFSDRVGKSIFENAKKYLKERRK